MPIPKANLNKVHTYIYCYLYYTNITYFYIYLFIDYYSRFCLIMYFQKTNNIWNKKNLQRMNKKLAKTKIFY